MSWTDERFELAKKLWNDGRSAAEIAAELGGGVSRSAVIGKLHRGRQVRAAPSPPKAKATPAFRAPKAKPTGLTHGTRMPSTPMKPAAAFVPPVADATFARSWATRKPGECAYPIGGEGADTLSCCAPGEARGETSAAYCPAHRKIMFQAEQPRAIRAGDAQRMRAGKTPFTPAQATLDKGWDAA